MSYYASNIKEIELYDKSPIKVEVDWDFPQTESGTIHFTMLSEDEFTLTHEDKGFFDFLSAQAGGPPDQQLLTQTYRLGAEIPSSNSKFTIHKIKNVREGDKLYFIIHNPVDVL